MKSTLPGFILFTLVAVSGLAQASSSTLTPWGMLNELGPWDSEDVILQQQQRIRAKQPTPPPHPVRKAYLRRLFSRPINHAAVDIDVAASGVQTFVRRANRVVPYQIQIRAITPDYPVMTLIGHPGKVNPPLRKAQFDLTCEIESMRRWERDRTHGWAVRIAATFNDKDSSKRLEKAKTVLISHGVCTPANAEPGLFLPGGFYEYHAAFVSRFEDTDKTAVMMELGTGMRFNSVGNGYFERARVLLAFTAETDRDQVRITYR